MANKNRNRGGQQPSLKNQGTPMPENKDDTSTQQPPVDGQVDQSAQAPGGESEQAPVLTGDNVPETPAVDQTPLKDEGPGETDPDPKFQNGAGETAQLSALTNATVSPIEAPAVEDKGVQDASKLPPPPTAPVAKVDQVPPPPTVAAAPEVKAPAVAETSTSGGGAETAVSKLIARAAGNLTYQALVHFLQSYLENMRKGRPVDPAVGITYQYQLWTVIKGVVEDSKSYEDFRFQWNLILAFFEQYKNDAYGPRHVFRFADRWQRDTDDLKKLQVLINLIHTTSNYETRNEDAKRKVDLARTMDFFSEGAKARVHQFYGQ